jgi:hypothetical protein
MQAGGKVAVDVDQRISLRPRVNAAIGPCRRIVFLLP